ncbi:response regulator [Paucibacter soli]|uniref:response regulator n=1 Tax=Paucibacter soli TaxID=3133433 RepID=UPI0030A6A581
MATILVVDDDARNLRLATEVLALGGHQAWAASSGLQALELALAQPPELILLDVQMPGMDGIETLKRLRAQPATAGLKVFALTALAMKGDRERLLAEGFDGYLEKPLRYKQLLESIARALAKP